MGYTEEEKEVLKTILENKDKILRIDLPEETKNTLKIIINLLKKQQKEIKELTVSNQELDKECSRLERKEVKIQKDIERLLRDNYRLDRENQLEFEKVVDTSDYVNKETIKNKIAELQERLKYYEELDLPQVDDNGVRTGIIKEEEILTSRARILILKELLGE